MKATRRAGLQMASGSHYTTSNPNEGVGKIWICKVSQSADGLAVISELHSVTNEDEQMYGLSWTPDSKSIIYSSKRTGPAQLYKVSIADGQDKAFAGWRRRI